MDTIEKAKQKRWMWIAGAVVVCLYFGPGIIGSVHEAIVVRHRAEAEAAKEKADRQKPAPAPPAPDAAAIQAAANAALSKRLAGKWEGVILLPSPPEGTCKIGLELRTNPDKDAAFAGYSNFSCAPSMMEVMAHQGGGHKMTPAEAMNLMDQALKPSAGIFSGVADKGAIKLTADKTLGTTPGGCSIVAISVMPFGANDMGAEFRGNDANGCQGGQLVMHRTGS